MSERMNPEVKAKWLEALRSGEYLQARGELRRDGTGREEFCCLGVLADLYRKDIGGYWTGFDEFVDVKGGCAKGSYLTDDIRRWAGARVDFSREFDSEFTLAGLNDGQRLGFPEIANLIEEYL